MATKPTTKIRPAEKPRSSRGATSKVAPARESPKPDRSQPAIAKAIGSDRSAAAKGARTGPILVPAARRPIVRRKSLAYSRVVPAAKPVHDATGENNLEEDYFVVPERGRAYGRCGGRDLKSLMEQRLCEKLSQLGVAHSHAPRRYEVKVDGVKMAAYSPSIVLRGRGREGKTAVVEMLASVDEGHLKKIEAFRRLYQAEFYLILVAPAVVMERVPASAYDESILPSEVSSLVARLAE